MTRAWALNPVKMVPWIRDASNDESLNVVASPADATSM